MKKLFVLFFIFVMAFALVACGSEPATDDGAADGAADGGEEATVLVAGAETTYPPFEYVEGEEIVGFDVDLWAAICEEMGVEGVMETYSWDGLISGLMAGKFDVIMSCMGITEARLEQIDFSNPYFYSMLGIAVRDEAGITCLEEVEGHVVGMQTGTLAETWFMENGADLNVAEYVVYDTMADGILDLQSGRIDAIFNDKPYLGYMLANEDGITVLPDVYGDAPAVGIGVDKSNAELTADINEALAAVVENGTWSEIYVKWFGAEPSEAEIPH